jgi:hypothetical protein
MPERYFQFDGSDGCVYIYDRETDACKKLCDIDDMGTELPPDVREKFKAEQGSHKMFMEVRF